VQWSQTRDRIFDTQRRLESDQPAPDFEQAQDIVNRIRALVQDGDLNVMEDDILHQFFLFTGPPLGRIGERFIIPEDRRDEYERYIQLVHELTNLMLPEDGGSVTRENVDNPEEGTSFSFTALMNAIRARNALAVDRLLARGANVMYQPPQRIWGRYTSDYPVINDALSFPDDDGYILNVIVNAIPQNMRHHVFLPILMNAITDPRSFDGRQYIIRTAVDAVSPNMLRETLVTPLNDAFNLGKTFDSGDDVVDEYLIHAIVNAVPQNMQHEVFLPSVQNAIETSNVVGLQRLLSASTSIYDQQFRMEHYLRYAFTNTTTNVRAVFDVLLRYASHEEMTRTRVWVEDQIADAARRDDERLNALQQRQRELEDAVQLALERHTEAREQETAALRAFEAASSGGGDADADLSALNDTLMKALKEEDESKKALKDVQTQLAEIRKAVWNERTRQEEQRLRQQQPLDLLNGAIEQQLPLLLEQPNREPFVSRVIALTRRLLFNWTTLSIVIVSFALYFLFTFLRS
jgi:hypothetical protein